MGHLSVDRSSGSAFHLFSRNTNLNASRWTQFHRKQNNILCSLSCAHIFCILPNKPAGTHHGLSGHDHGLCCHGRLRDHHWWRNHRGWHHRRDSEAWCHHSNVRCQGHCGLVYHHCLKNNNHTTLYNIILDNCHIHCRRSGTLILCM